VAAYLHCKPWGENRGVANLPQSYCTSPCDCAPDVGQAHAQRLKVEAFIQQWDADHDGTLSLDEIKKAASGSFDALDRNHDGKLTRGQVSGMFSFREFHRADRDNDGRLDKNEFLAVVEQRFLAADKDHDGTLDKKELETLAGRVLLRLFAPRRGPIM
jgi:Ca2+-binding EF-hand superfamily protein